jgi:hypothetical protein
MPRLRRTLNTFRTTFTGSPEGRALLLGFIFAVVYSVIRPIEGFDWGDASPLLWLLQGVAFWIVFFMLWIGGFLLAALLWVFSRWYVGGQDWEPFKDHQHPPKR